MFVQCFNNFKNILTDAMNNKNAEYFKPNINMTLMALQANFNQTAHNLPENEINNMLE